MHIYADKAALFFLTNVKLNFIQDFLKKNIPSIDLVYAKIIWLNET